MKFCNVHLIGAGGTGTHLLEPLARMMSYHHNGCSNYYIADGDRFESSNSTRQLFDPKFIGVNKAEAAALKLQSIFNLNVIPNPNFVRKQDFKNQFLRNYYKDCKAVGEVSLVIIAVDSTASRKELIEALDSTPDKVNFVCILPGNDFRTATCIWYKRINGKVMNVHPFEIAPNYADPTDEPRGSCAYQEVSSPQLICANMVGALMSLECIYNFLEDLPLPCVIEYSGVTLSMETSGKFK